MSDPIPTGHVTCDHCGERHQATYSHEGRFGEGALYAVVCTADGMTDYYTAERLLSTPQEAARAALSVCASDRGCSRPAMTGALLCAAHVLAAVR
jgi:hypothetical protein